MVRDTGDCKSCDMQGMGSERTYQDVAARTVGFPSYSTNLGM